MSEPRLRNIPPGCGSGRLDDRLAARAGQPRADPRGGWTRDRSARPLPGPPRAAELFERLLGLRNDVGLLAKEYDPHTERLLGNFPQAFSYIALINSAFNLVQTETRCGRGKHQVVSRAQRGEREYEGPGGNT